MLKGILRYFQEFKMYVSQGHGKEGYDLTKFKEENATAHEGLEAIGQALAKVKEKVTDEQLPANRDEAIYIVTMYAYIYAGFSSKGNVDAMHYVLFVDYSKPSVFLHVSTAQLRIPPPPRPLMPVPLLYCPLAHALHAPPHHPPNRAGLCPALCAAAPTSDGAEVPVSGAAAGCAAQEQLHQAGESHGADCGVAGRGGRRRRRPQVQEAPREGGGHPG